MHTSSGPRPPPVLTPPPRTQGLAVPLPSFLALWSCLQPPPVLQGCRTLGPQPLLLQIWASGSIPLPSPGAWSPRLTSARPQGCHGQETDTDEEQELRVDPQPSGLSHLVVGAKLVTW